MGDLHSITERLDTNGKRLDVPTLLATESEWARRRPETHTGVVVLYVNDVRDGDADMFGVYYTSCGVRNTQVLAALEIFKARILQDMEFIPRVD